MDINNELLRGLINQIGVDLGLMTPDAQARVLEVQARCVALAKKGTPSTAARANDDAWWQQQQVDDAALQAARVLVQSGQGVDGHTVPASGQIAAAIGAIDGDTEQALLTAQAAARAVKMVDTVFDASVPEHTHNPALFSHMRDTDPQQLRFAQEANKLASEIAAEVRRPEFKLAAPDVQDKAFAEYQSSVGNLRTQALEAYHQSAIMLGVRAVELTKANDPRAAKTAEIADALNRHVVSIGGKGITDDELAAYAAARAQGGQSGPEQAQQSQSFVNRVRKGVPGQQLG